MNKFRILLVVIFFQIALTNLFGKELFEKPIVVIIPSYNNIDWFENNLTSIFSQEYTNYRIIYVNDNSKDGTGQAVEKYLSQANIDYRVINFDDSPAKTIPEATQLLSDAINAESHFFTLVNNINRCGGLANLYRPIHSCSDKEIIVTVDGDDWLLHTQVLKELNKVYSKNNIWLTHGTFQNYPSGQVTWSEAIPPQVITKRSFRESKCPSHLRTFYAWLFKRIKLDDLLYDGKFFWMTWDMAMMFPMLEMACERHAFISNPNYSYNTANQINDHKVDRELQLKLEQYIRNMPHYKRLRKIEKKSDYGF